MPIVYFGQIDQNRVLARKLKRDRALKYRLKNVFLPCIGKMFAIRKIKHFYSDF